MSPQVEAKALRHAARALFAHARELRKASRQICERSHQLRVRSTEILRRITAKGNESKVAVVLE